MTAGRARSRRPRRGASTLAAVPFLVHRGAAQASLLAAVVGVVVAATTLAGTMALVLTGGREAAAHAALAAREPDRLTAEVTFRPSSLDPTGVVDDAREALTAATAPFEPYVSTWLTTAVRPLEGSDLRAYVGAISDATEVAELVEGRWPRSGAGRLEVVVPEDGRAALDAVGAELVLGPVQDGRDDPARPGATAQDLVVVGTYRPAPGATRAWRDDVLRGTGHATGWRPPATPDADGVEVVGPLLADPASLLAGPPSVTRVAITATPGTVVVDGAERGAVRSDLARLVGLLRERLGDGAIAERVDAPLGRTLAQLARHERGIGSLVLVMAVLGVALAGTALALVGRLVAARREGETGLLVARGARRSQLVGRAGLESVVVAVAGAAVAAPLAALLYGRVANAAGLDAPTLALTTPLLVTVAVAGLALAGVLTWPAAAAEPEPRGRRPRAGVARTALDVVLVAAAVVAYLQLRSHTVAASGGTDPVLVLAPALWLVAGAVLGLRLVPWVARRGERRAARSRRLVVPLATWEVARRRHSAGAALLLLLAAASTTFVAVLDATWELSVRDQGDVRIGTDLEVARTEEPPVAQAVALAGATGTTVLPVVDREVVLGTPAGAVAPGSRLLAFDTAAAAPAMLSRLPDGATWAELLAPLAPPPATPVRTVLHDGALRVEVTASVEGTDADLQAVTTLVVRVPDGARATLVGPSVPLDGAPHVVDVAVPHGTTGAAGWEVVAVALDMSLAQPADVDLGQAGMQEYPVVHVSVAFPDATGPAPDGWAGTLTAAYQDLLRDATVTARHGEAVALDAVASVHAWVLHYLGARLLLTAAPTAQSVPVLLTSDLAREIAAEPGNVLALDVDGVALTARVEAVLPELAAPPHGASIVADVESVARASLAARPDLDLADAWWLMGAEDPDGAAAAVAAEGLGAATTRASIRAESAQDPLQALLRMTLRLLVVAACALAVVGTAAQTAALVRSRAVDVARLLGMGVPGRTVTATLVLEHLVVSAVALVAGAVVGGAGGRLVAPLLVVASDGGRPVPAARPVWAWLEQGALIVVLVVGCAAVATPVAARLVARARASHLRMEAAS